MSNNSDLPRFVPVPKVPREWRVGDVVQVGLQPRKPMYLIGQTPQPSGRKTWSGLSESGLLNVGWLETPEYPNLGPHRIEPDGQGGLRFVPVEGAEEEGWVDLGDCKPGDLVQFKRTGFLAMYCGVTNDGYERVVFPGGDRQSINGTAPVRVVGKFVGPKQESK